MRSWSGIASSLIALRIARIPPRHNTLIRSTMAIWKARSSDGEGVDVRVGTLDSRRVVGIICTVDGLKREVEVKLLLSGSPVEIGLVREFFSRLQMGCLVVLREAE